jgi:F0F1-type ATP synthase assembly protein I
VTAVELPDVRRVALGIVLGQACLSAVIAVLCYALASPSAGWSAAIGGGIGTAASLVHSLIAFRQGERDLARVARAFFIGEAAKLGVVVVLFVLVLTTIKDMVVPVALLGAFMATFVVYWVGLARVRSAFGGG